MKLTFPILKKLYQKDKKSASEISKLFKCSENKVTYWLKKYNIPKRTISEAVYVKNNPSGDPFKIKTGFTKEEEKLFGLGLGLYWGEGHKKNKTSLRLGNTNAKLIKKFMEFLVKIYNIRKDDLSFNLLIFNDVSIASAKKFWVKELRIKAKQIRGKVSVIKLNRTGTYRQKAKYGVIILQYHNKKLRDIICDEIDNL